MSSPSSRWSIFSSPETTPLRFITRVSIGCRRAKARSCLVSAAARCPASLMPGQVAGEEGVLLVALEQQVAVAEDGEQAVVEVVGDAGREAADRLHLLRVQELALERLVLGLVALALRDVADGDHRDLLALEEVALAGDLDVDRRAVAAGSRRSPAAPLRGRPRRRPGRRAGGRGSRPASQPKMASSAWLTSSTTPLRTMAIPSRVASNRVRKRSSLRRISSSAALRWAISCCAFS